jgi:hypothetical protein
MMHFDSFQLLIDAGYVKGRRLATAILIRWTSDPPRIFLKLYTQYRYLLSCKI